MMAKDLQTKIIDSLASDADIIILAGDICNARNAERTYTRFCNMYEYVICISGNHEHYKDSLPGFAKEMNRVSNKLSNLYWLDIDHNPVCVISGQRFVGDTLWFPGIPDARMRASNWSDFIYIKDAVNAIFTKHERAAYHLDLLIEENDIVITHMAPSYLSVGDNWIGDPYNCMFVANMEQLILDKKPRYWIHGHMHDPKDYLIGNTNVICNPRGYTWRGEGSNFDPYCLIEV